MQVPARSRLVPLTAFLLAAMTASGWAAPRPVTEQAKLLAAQEKTGDAFGTVAVECDTAIVGARGADRNAGAAYVFTRGNAGWSQQARLVSSDRSEGSFDLFGSSVAVSGDTAAVASYFGHPDVLSGAVYVFVRTGTSWSEQARLTAPDATDYDYFGSSLAISGDTIAVGAVDYAHTTGAGAVYVFVRNGTTWSLQAKLLAASGMPGDFLGVSVAVQGDTLVAGAPYTNSTGAAYVFKRAGASWFEQAKLLPSDGEPFELLGQAVAISGGTVLVGAPRTPNGTATAPGAVYVFLDNGSVWSQQARLLASDGELDDFFGSSVALSGDTAVAGAMDRDDFTGAAYLFVRRGTEWSEQAKLVASDGKPFDLFGTVAVSGGTAMVGALVADDPWAVQDVGAVYLFPASGVAVAPTALLMTRETTQFSVALDIQPAGDVVIDLASSDADAGTVSPTQLTFTPGDWSAQRTVTLTRIAASGPPYTIALGIDQELTQDSFYDGVDPDDVSAIPLEFTGDFYTVTPCRVLDTRQPDQGPPLLSGVSRIVAFHDTCGVPATARAVVINATVVQPAGAGYAAIHPGDLPPPRAETLVFAAGRTVSANAIVPLATDGTGTLAVAPLVVAGGSAHLVIDVQGYFE